MQWKVKGFSGYGIEISHYKAKIIKVSYNNKKLNFNNGYSM